MNSASGHTKEYRMPEGLNQGFYSRWRGQKTQVEEYILRTRRLLAFASQIRIREFEYKIEKAIQP
jgi:hypothetical protein